MFGDVQLDIIDTPGLADTRGKKQEQENIANIIAIVKKEVYINCVCLVINGTQCRLPDVVKTVLSKIISILLPDELSNIISVFTNVRDELSLVFDTRIFNKFQLKIPDHHVFTIDNPYSRYSKVSKASPMTHAKLQKRFLRDFKETHEILERILALVKTFKPTTIKFGELYEVSHDIRDSFLNLQIQNDNIKQIKKGFANGSKTEIQFSQTKLDFTDRKTVSCTICLRNCHPDCHCWFASNSIQTCNVFKNGQCLHCGHGYLDHNRSNRFFNKYVITLLKPSKDETLKEGLSSYYHAIEEETEALKAKIMKFQYLGSNLFFSKKAVDVIEVFKKDIEKIPYYKYKQDITASLDATLEVLHNPHTAKNNEAKFLWACGILGVDPNNVTESNITKLFRQLTKKIHPDHVNNKNMYIIEFKHVCYAKQFLMDILLGSTK